MPLPMPRKDEKKDDFVDRCMADDTMRREFRQPEQRRAVCERQWEDGRKGRGSMRYAHVISYVLNTIWAIWPPKLQAMMDALAFLASGGEYSAAEIEAIVGAKPRQPERQPGTGIAIMPLHGVISHRAGMLSESSGGTSTERFAAQLRAYLADPEVGAIVLDVDSPGGAVPGVDELASEIYEARKAKHIVASINSMAASAAYWIASAASEVTITPSGEVGSIGVIAAHEDRSALLEKIGIRPTLITAGKYKAEGNPYQPLTEEAREYIQSQVDDYYAMFVRAVARGRNVTQREVREGYGEGRMVLAKDALKMGMVDRIETMDETIARLKARGDGSVANAKANTEEPAVRANVEEPDRRSIEQARAWLELQRLR